MVRDYLSSYTERMLDTDNFFEELQLSQAERGAALRELSRMVANGTLVWVCQGVYAKSKVSRITQEEMPISEREIIAYYTRDGVGFLAGYDLYNRKNISTQVSKRKIVFSNRIEKERRILKSVTVKRIGLNLTDMVRQHLEMLEVVDNLGKIQDFNEGGFQTLIEVFAPNYNTEIMASIANQGHYEKQTLETLDRLVEHSLDENSIR